MLLERRSPNVGERNYKNIKWPYFSCEPARNRCYNAAMHTHQHRFRQWLRPRAILRLGLYAGISLTLLITAAAPPAEAAVPRTRHQVGIATGASLLYMNDTQLTKRLRDIERLGASWIRVDFNWYAIQPVSRDQFRWELYDRVVAQASAHKLKILAVLGYTPEWAQEPYCAQLARSTAAAQKCNPHDNDDFGHFAGTVAERYADKNIRAWEIWNEPNLVAYWKTAKSNGTTFVDPKAYARLANAGAREIRKHSDGAILTGGMGPMFEPSRSRGMSQSDFLARMLPRLQANLFSGVAMHPYSWPLLPTKPATYNAFYTVDNGRPAYNLRTVMKRAGWNKKQIWATEYGASTKGKRPLSNKRSARNRPDHVSEARQAHIIQQGIEAWFKKPAAGPIFIHSDGDAWLRTHKNEGGFGLRRADGSKKPAYKAVQKAVHRLHYKKK